MALDLFINVAAYFLPLDLWPERTRSCILASSEVVLLLALEAKAELIKSDSFKIHSSGGPLILFETISN